MYPYFRMVKELWRFRNAPKLGLFDTHVSHHMCLPWDIDPWMELNNGRTLTLYDLGRVPMARRMGLDRAMKANGWGLAVAGNTTRYRKRVQMFDRLTMHSRVLGWNARFFYIEQSMWKEGECTSHILIRSALIGAGRTGIIAPAHLARACNQPEQSPPLPDWVTGWIAADAARPWPPQR
jgi:acyl-CoA thioesterase FadM